MGLLMLLDGVGSGVLLLALVGAVALTVWDCKARDMPLKQTLWWASLTLLLHVLGYLILRIWLLANPRTDTGIA